MEQALFGLLPGQAETFLGDPMIGPQVKLVALFTSGLDAEDANSLVGQDSLSNLFIARRTAFNPFLARFGITADIVYAISKSDSHTRASAWSTSDDDGRGGVPFTLDGVSLSHRFYSLIPGTIAQHSTSSSLTALHEFGHAASSYTNGQIVDLYVDSKPGANNKRGRPIPVQFSVYEGTTFAADTVRDGLGYPSYWSSYHCELHDHRYPAVMDDYWKAFDGTPEHCQHDQLTRRFLLDRVRAKLAR